MQEIRVRKRYMDQQKKKYLKKWGITLKYDGNWDAYILFLPETITLVRDNTSADIYDIYVDDKTKIGFVTDSNSPKGGYITVLL